MVKKGDIALDKTAILYSTSNNNYFDEMIGVEVRVGGYSRHAMITLEHEPFVRRIYSTRGAIQTLDSFC